MFAKLGHCQLLPVAEQEWECAVRFSFCIQIHLIYNTPLVLYSPALTPNAKIRQICYICVFLLFLFRVPCSGWFEGAETQPECISGVADGCRCDFLRHTRLQVRHPSLEIGEIGSPASSTKRNHLRISHDDFRALRGQELI